MSRFLVESLFPETTVNMMNSTLKGASSASTGTRRTIGSMNRWDPRLEPLKITQRTTFHLNVPCLSLALLPIPTTISTFPSAIPLLSLPPPPLASNIRRWIPYPGETHTSMSHKSPPLSHPISRNPFTALRRGASAAPSTLARRAFPGSGPRVFATAAMPATKTPASTYTPPKELYNFELVKTEFLVEYDSLAMLYRHKKTGTEVMSLVNKDENKTFGVVLRTPPANSTGIPHILEHSVLW